MFNVRETMAMVPQLFGKDVAPIVLSPMPHPGMADSPAQRNELAGDLAMAVLYDAYARARRQKGGEPVMVVACADCAVGRLLIAKRRTIDMLDELVGPMVWAWTETEALAELGPANWRALSDVLDAIGHVDGGMRVLLAVNANGLEPRVFRMAPPPAPAKPRPTADELNAAAAAQAPAPPPVC